MATTKKSLFRYANDSYPIVSSIKVNGTSVPLGKWNVYFYYNEVVNGVDKKIRIDGVADSRVTGKVSFFPRTKYSYDETNSVPVKAFSVVGNFEFSIVRTGVGYEADAAGAFVLVDGTYVTYDAGIHTGLPRFAEYEESMTHATGMIQVGDRL